MMDGFIDFVSQVTGTSRKTGGRIHLFLDRSWAAPACKRNIFQDDESECSVCLSVLSNGDHTRRLPCRHLFHRTCIDKWLDASGATCPLCRLAVSREPIAETQKLTDEMVVWFSSFHVAGF